MKDVEWHHSEFQQHSVTRRITLRYCGVLHAVPQISSSVLRHNTEARTPDSDPRFLGSPANNMQAIYCSSVARRAAAQRLLSRGYPSARSQLFRFTICFVVLRDGVFACLAQVPLLPSELAP